jgi:hypothetical protein
MEIGLAATAAQTLEKMRCLPSVATTQRMEVAAGAVRYAQTARSAAAALQYAIAISVLRVRRRRRPMTAAWRLLARE